MSDKIIVTAKNHTNIKAIKETGINSRHPTTKKILSEFFEAQRCATSIRFVRSSLFVIISASPVFRVAGGHPSFSKGACWRFFPSTISPGTIDEIKPAHFTRFDIQDMRPIRFSSAEVVGAGLIFRLVYGIQIMSATGRVVCITGENGKSLHGLGPFMCGRGVSRFTLRFRFVFEIQGAQTVENNQQFKESSTIFIARQVVDLIGMAQSVSKGVSKITFRFRSVLRGFPSSI